MDQFEAYFKRADLNQDGQISGAEAVTFFQGSGLSKQVLAQIWTYADQNRSGFLGRPEFFNALKLVTVAQSKRDLTPEIVRAALYGPASSKIPPPQINLPPSPMPQPSAISTSPAMQMGAMTTRPLQNLGYSGSTPPNQNMNQQYFPSPGNQLIRPSQGLPTSLAPLSAQSAPGLPNLGFSSAGIPNSGMLTPSFPSSGMSTPGQPNPSMSAGWGERPNGHPSGPTSQVPSRPSIPSASPQPQFPSQSANNDPRVISVSGNGFLSNSTGGDDPFADFQTITTPAASASTPSLPVSSAIVPVSGPPPAFSTPTSSAIVPVSFATQPTSTSSSLDSLQSAFAKQPFGGQPHQAQAFSSLPQPIPQVTSSGVSPGNSAGAANSIPDQSQPPWPKLTTSGIQKYTKVFMEVDTDRDGKITGEQARNLFLSWRLPREVLKQVWDLADQDNDSKLSLREFCIALYLMERYREGRSLPGSLPNSIMLDETLMRMAGLPHSSHGSPAWGSTSGTGLRPVHGGSGPLAMAPAAGVRPIMHSASQTDRTIQFHQQKSNLLVSDNTHANVLDEDAMNFVQPSPPEANDTENKVAKVEKVILDSREKLEFYRTKMQELVLYKSRCDNRLNEIIERANADKREADMLGRKYEEKYKQVAEIASKLTIEEARFREYQERKMELQQAITNMEQGGSADGILQVRADRIQSDLEELVKALSERSKKHGIEIKSAALIDLPIGWQPGIQEEACVWDEEWDKFDDEGLLFEKEVNVDAQNVNDSPKSILYQNGIHSHDERFSPESSSFADGQSEKQLGKGGEQTFDGESAYTHSEDESARSPPHRAAPSQDFSDVFAKSSEADTDFTRSFDDQGWGTFDGTDDAESVWGFNSKELGLDHHHGDGVFDSSSFGLSPRNQSPQQGDNKRSPFNFADSVPGTPSFSKSPRYSESGDGFFDNYSRFDSFSVNESSSQFSPPRETLTRFDSTNSSKGTFDQSRRFTSFDDADPFGSTGPFKVSSEASRKGSDNWSSF